MEGVIMERISRTESRRRLAAFRAGFERLRQLDTVTQKTATAEDYQASKAITSVLFDELRFLYNRLPSYARERAWMVTSVERVACPTRGRALGGGRASPSPLSLRSPVRPRRPCSSTSGSAPPYTPGGPSPEPPTGPARPRGPTPCRQTQRSLPGRAPP